MKRLFILLILGVAGILAPCAGFVIFRAESVGYFIKWEQLPKAPSQVVELIASRESNLYVRAADGQTLSWDGRSWDVAQVPEGLETGWAFYKPCRQEMPQFSPLSRPPTGWVDCIQDEGVYAEFYNKHVYVLDAQGNVWQWALLTHALAQVIKLVAYPCLGGMVGLALGVAALFVMRKRGNK